MQRGADIAALITLITRKQAFEDDEQDSGYREAEAFQRTLQVRHAVAAACLPAPPNSAHWIPVGSAWCLTLLAHYLSSTRNPCID